MSMPRRRRPQVPMAQRRAELTEAALRVMARDGAWALTTRALAAEAGLAHGSVHYAFSSKAEIVRAVIAADTESAVQIFSTVGAGGGGAREVLEHAFSAFVERILSHPQTELVLYELTLMAVRDPDLGALLAESGASYTSSLGRLLEELAGRCGGAWDAPVQVIVEQLLSLLFGSAQSWLAHRDEVLLRATLDDAARVFAGRLQVPAPPHT